MTKRAKSIICLVMAIFFITTGPAFANKHKPTQAQIDAAKKVEAEKKAIADRAASKLSKAKADLRQLTSIADAANAKYVTAKKFLAMAIQNLAIAQKAYAAALEAVSQTQRDIGKMASNAYMNGGSMSELEMFLDAKGPQGVIDRITTLDQLGHRNRTALARFKIAANVAKSAKAATEVAKTKQAQATAVLQTAKRAADDSRIAQAAEVSKLQSVQNKLASDLARSRNVRISLEQKRQLALLEENRAQVADQTKVTSKVWRTSGPKGASSTRSSIAQRLQAVDFAKRQVLAGKPYVWGAQGPNSFDCSGLVYAAYKSAGLGWPNWDRLNAALYYTYTKQIPLSDMQPGDLLFYSFNGSIAGIHHMSIYAGNGMMWEARSTKTGLRYSSIHSVDGMMPYVGRV